MQLASSMKKAMINQKKKSDEKIERENDTIKCAFETVFYLAQTGRPNQDYANEINFLAYKQVTGAQNLIKNGTVKYSHTQSVQEMQDCISKVIDEQILEEMLSSESNGYSLMLDESTDIAVVKKLLLYSRYTFKGKVHTRFMANLDILNGTAEQIVQSVSHFLETKNLNISNLLGLGSDGASTMVGRKN